MILHFSKDINKLEEKMSERLSGEDKTLFLDFCNAYGELMGESGLDSFLTGFRLGAKMIFDTFCSDDAPFESYLKDLKIYSCVIQSIAIDEIVED